METPSEFDTATILGDPPTGWSNTMQELLNLVCCQQKEIKLAKERLGPAGWKILNDYLDMKKAFKQIHKEIRGRGIEMYIDTDILTLLDRMAEMEKQNVGEGLI